MTHPATPTLVLDTTTANATSKIPSALKFSNRKVYMTTQYAPHPDLERKQPSPIEEPPLQFPLKKRPNKTKRKATQPEGPSHPIQHDDPITGTGIFAHDAKDDIPYHALLSRLFMQRDYYPSLNTYVKDEEKVAAPHLISISNKKTVFANFPEITRPSGRDREHVKEYLFSELGTTGTLDEKGALVLKGRFQEKQIGHVMRRYSSTYVVCQNCGSHSTSLNRENKLQPLATCNKCQKQYSVPKIKTGFVNRIPRRRQPKKEEVAPEPEAEEEDVKQDRHYTRPLLRSKL